MTDYINQEKGKRKTNPIKTITMFKSRNPEQDGEKPLPSPRDIIEDKTEIKIITWTDSYGASSGWQDIEEYEAIELIVTSVGVIVYENENVIALALNYAKATTLTPEQANGIMVIPKCSIKDITSFSCSEPALKQMRRHF